VPPAEPVTEANSSPPATRAPNRIPGVARTG
jgi:hypothetical protein